MFLDFFVCVVFFVPYPGRRLGDDGLFPDILYGEHVFDETKVYREDKTILTERS